LFSWAKLQLFNDESAATQTQQAHKPFGKSALGTQELWYGDMNLSVSQTTKKLVAATVMRQ